MQLKHWFKKYFIHSLLFLGGVVAGFLFLSYISTLFQIKNVEVFGVTKDEHKILSHIFKNRSSLFLSHDEVIKEIHMRFPTIEIKEDHIKLPDSLILILNKPKPLAYLKTDFGYIALSKDGTILMKERSLNTPYPFISFYQLIHHSEYQVGNNIKFTAIEKTLLFISILSDLGYATETVAIDSVDVIACKTKGFEVAFSQSRPVDLQVHEVRQIARQIKAGALQVERLDLRFDKPVVQLPKK